MPAPMNRRAILAGAAALPAASIPALAATEPDPIYAAIQAHRRMRADINLLSDAEIEATDGLRIFDEGSLALLNTAPTTVAGVAALLEYCAEYSLQGNEWGSRFVEDDTRPCGFVLRRDLDWQNEHGLDFETVVEVNCARALRAIAA